MDSFNYPMVLLKIIVGFSILNTWIFQSKKPSRWRTGNANTLDEEFKIYGLPKYIFYIVGCFKISLAVLLLTSIKFKSFTVIASLGLAGLFLVFIVLRIKAGDAYYKLFPSLLFLILNLIITTYKGY